MIIAPSIRDLMNRSSRLISLFYECDHPTLTVDDPAAPALSGQQCLQPTRCAAAVWRYSTRFCPDSCAL
eukprot:4674556-Prymnesium_polylepis.1